jgi:hypothetical protein
MFRTENTEKAKQLKPKTQISYEAALSRVCTSCAWFVPG